MNKPSAHPFIDTLSQLIIKLRIAILGLFVLSFAVLSYYATQFNIDASADTLLTKNNELFIKTQLANQKFSPSEFILIAYQPDSGDVFTEQTISDIETLSTEFAKLDRVKSINSMLTVPLIENREQLVGSEGVGDLNYNKQQYSLEKMRELLRDHPIYTDLLVNQELSATAIQLVFKSDPQLDNINTEIVNIQAKLLSGNLSEQEQSKLETLQLNARNLEREISQERVKEVEKIEQIISSVTQNAEVYIGGSYVVGIRLIEIVTQDLLYFGLSISALISVLLLVLFRTLKWLFFPLFACASSVSITMGILAIFKIPATVISANFVALQLILTLAIMLHLITCYREISRQSPKLSQGERVKSTLKEKLTPCFYAAITTSVGFGSLIFSGIQPVIDFGIMMLISNMVTLCVALLVFPAILSFLPASKETEEFNFVKSILSSIKQQVAKRTKSLIIVPAAALIIVSTGIAYLNVENSFIDYFADDTTIYKELSFIDKEFGGSTPLDIIIDTKAPAKDQGLFVPAEQVNQLHLGHAAVVAFEATGNVTSLINFTTLAKQLNDGAPLTEYELDVIYKTVDKQVIDELIGAYIDVESNTMRISTRIQDTLPELNRAEFLDNLRADLGAVGFGEDQYQLTNLFVLYQDILSRLFDSQIQTLGIVYAALALILLLIFRSIKVALIALIPNIITTTAILGIIAWLGIPLDLMTITIAAIAMGIAIDDTIHFTDAYLSAEPGEGLQKSFSHTGQAMTYTSTLIALGFGMFIFSDFMPSVYFGLLTACAMLLALIVDLTVLPAMLETFVKKDSQAATE